MTINNQSKLTGSKWSRGEAGTNAVLLNYPLLKSSELLVKIKTERKELSFNL